MNYFYRLLVPVLLLVPGLTFAQKTVQLLTRKTWRDGMLTKPVQGNMLMHRMSSQ